MTVEFIENVINSSDLNTWTTLTGVCQRIGMLGDDTIYIDPLHKIFYFDTDNELLYIRKLTGSLTQNINNTEVDGYASIEINGVNYLNKIAGDYVEHDEIGAFHTAVSFDKIVAFYYPNINKEVTENYLKDILEGI